ncbi:reverse transcriptase (RNA-dependent DNA polymerase) [Hirsutella rhossiliensis]
MSRVNTAIKGTSSLADKLIYDSGADVNLFNNLGWFQEGTFKWGSNDEVQVGDQAFRVQGTGTAVIPTIDGGKITLLDAYFIPEMPTSVFSARLGMTAGIFWNQLLGYLYSEPTKEVRIKLTDFEGQFVMGTLPQHKRVFAVTQAPKPPTGGVGDLWHRRLGHPGPKSLEKLSEACLGTKLQGPTTCSCQICATGKAKREVSRKTPSLRPKGPGVQVSFDLHPGPITAYNGEKNFALFTCMDTSMRFYYPMERKTGIRDIFNNFVALLETQYGVKMTTLVTDGERALLTTEQIDYMTNRGIRVIQSAPSTPTQNGHAERSGAIVKEKARVMRLDSKLPEELWPEIYRTAVYLLNITPFESYDHSWQSPHERWWTWMKENNPLYHHIKDVKPDITHLRVFGCIAFPMTITALEHIKSHKTQSPLEQRAHIGYLVGYRSTQQYVVWIPSIRQNKLMVSANVQFNESVSYDTKREEQAQLVQTYSYDILRDMAATDVIDSGEPETFGVPSLSDDDTDDGQTPEEAITLPRDPLPPHTPEDQGLKTPLQGSHRYTYLSPPETVGLGTEISTSPLLPDTVFDTELPSSVPPTPAIDTIASNPSHISLGRQLEDAIPISIDSSPQDERNDIPLNLGGEGTIVVRVQEDDPQSEPRTLNPANNADERIRHKGLTQATLLKENGLLHVEDMPPPPTSFNAAMASEFAHEWKEAADREMEENLARGTWKTILKAVIKQKGHFLIPLRWVFAYKTDEQGYITRFKARIVVRGDLQPEGDEDTYAATLRARTFRLLIAFCCLEDFETEQYDVKTAFLYAILRQEVYCQPPPGFSMPGLCLKLLKALYGLRISPKLWFEEISSFFTELGAQQLVEDACVLVYKGVIIFIFVDDIVMMYPKRQKQDWEELHKAITKKYTVTHMGELRWFLGIEIIRDRDLKKIWLSQASYISKTAKKYHILDNNILREPKIPLTTEELVPYEKQASKEEIHEYLSLIGPDIAFAAGKLAQYNYNPGPRHRHEARKCLAYIYHTRNRCICFTATNPTRRLMCASDSSYADDPETRKSSQGYVFLLLATKQATITTSSTEAELLALSQTAKEQLWCDNLQTIRLLTELSAKLKTNLKHVDEVQQDRIQVSWIASADNPADGMTKALTHQKHQSFIKQLGLVTRPEDISRDDVPNHRIEAELDNRRIPMIRAPLYALRSGDSNGAEGHKYNLQLLVKRSTPPGAEEQTEPSSTYCPTIWKLAREMDPIVMHKEACLNNMTPLAQGHYAGLTQTKTCITKFTFLCPYFFHYLQEAKDSSVPLALSYAWREKDQRYKELPYLDVEHMSGAGGIISNVIDYAQWLKCLIHEAKPFSKAVHKDIRTPRFIHDARPALGIDVDLYGLAWQRTTIHGQVVYWHYGSTITFGALVYWLPEVKFGIVALANGAETSNQAELILVRRLLDDKLRIPLKDRLNVNKKNNRLKERERDMQRDIEKADDILFPERPKRPSPPSIKPSELTGLYSNLGYGQITLFQELLSANLDETVLVADRIELLWAQQWRLHHVSGDYWTLYSKMLLGINAVTRFYAAEFKIGVDGKVAGLEVSMYDRYGGVNEGTVLFHKVGGNTGGRENGASQESLRGIEEVEYVFLWLSIQNPSPLSYLGGLKINLHGKHDRHVFLMLALLCTMALDAFLYATLIIIHSPAWPCIYGRLRFCYWLIKVHISKVPTSYSVLLAAVGIELNRSGTAVFLRGLPLTLVFAKTPKYSRKTLAPWPRDATRILISQSSSKTQSILRLHRQQRLVAAGMLQVVKLVTAGLALVTAILLCLLSYLEHGRSIRPLSILLLYCMFSTLFDAIRARTVWLVSPASTLAALAIASVVAKAVVLVLESHEKSNSIIAPKEAYGPESTSSVLNRSIFFWLNRVVWNDDLDLSRLPFPRCLGKFEVEAKKLRMHASPFRHLEVANTQDTLAAVLLHNLIEYLGQASIPETEAVVAVATGAYWYHHYRVLTMIRGCLVSAIGWQTLRINIYAMSDPKAPLGTALVVPIVVTAFSSIATMQAAQSRIGATSNILSSIKAIKMRALTTAGLGYMPQFISPLLTFLLFDASRAFTSLSLLLLIAQSLSQTLLDLLSLLAAFGSSARIDEFLLTEHQTDFRDFNMNTGTKAASTDMEDPSMSDGIVEEKAPVELSSKSAKAPAAGAMVIFFTTSTLPSHGATLLLLSGRSPMANLPSTPTWNGKLYVLGDSKKIGFCSQTPYLANGTIKENIVGYSDFSRPWYNAVISACALSYDIAQMPSRDSTVIGSDGINLSGGQRQKGSNHIFWHVMGPEGIARRQNITVIFATHATQFLPFSDHIVALGSSGKVAQ